MSPKYINFFAMAWFLSTLICVVLEGSNPGLRMNSVINDLNFISSFNIGDIISIPVFNLNFIRGVMRMLLWDYSFYTGGYSVIKYVWMAVLDVGLMWGICQLVANAWSGLIGRL